MDYQKLILRIKCPEIRECPFREPMSCTKCRNAVGEDSVFAIKELLSEVEELEAKNRILEEARENANEACAKWEGLYRAELEKKSAWVSVRDRLPEKGEYVLVYANAKYINSKKVCIDRLEDGEKTAVWMYTHGWFEVTHWMPLPEPPKEE